jgi:hypothetical protein
MGKIDMNSKTCTFHGRTGKYIHYYVKGYHYVRTHAIPRNPRSIKQQKNRCTFAEAVRSWQVLSPEEQAACNRKASKERYSGYNLFISMYMKGISLSDKIQALSFHVPGMLRTSSVSIPFIDCIDPFKQFQPVFVLKKPRVPVYPAA